MRRSHGPTIADALPALWRAVFAGRFWVTVAMVFAIAYAAGSDRARLHNQQDRAAASEQTGQPPHIRDAGPAAAP
ncbi:hypothetical protein L2D00_11095 [Hyphomonadaceae bacterium BL14]|nr:hypothetical protein L2D00_11095 [Hyphomonadaceae bacterium BL14]